jgi:hypothetical protein
VESYSVAFILSLAKEVVTSMGEYSTQEVKYYDRVLRKMLGVDSLV